MKKYLIINGKTLYLKSFNNETEAKKWAVSNGDHTHGIVLLEFERIFDYINMLVSLN